METLLNPEFHRYLIGSLFMVAGVLHFLKPGFFMKIMPDYLPWHKPLVLISGFFEIIGGIGMLFSSLQLIASYGLIILLFAVFPANIEMFKKYYRKNGFTPFVWALLIRLPLQFVFIGWVYWAGILN
ncbi:MAG: hypothetical protein RI564_11375 [Gracilimonas sp.]|jgi:uncharacterized membrane protein|nr:hypothetical protein [Gracilimonas sp.]